MAGTSTFLIENTRLQKRLGDASTATLVYIKQFVNDAYRDVVEAYDWPWVHYESAVNLIAKYNTGTITTTAGATTLTSSGATWLAAWSPARIRTAGGHEYVITESGGTWTLDRNALATETAVAYTLFKDRYTLAARLRSLYLAWTTVTDAYPVEIVTPSQMAVLKAGGIAASNPVRAICFVDADSTNIVSQVEVWPIPDTAHSLHYKGYRQVADLSADADVFLFPPGLLSTFRARADFYAYGFRGNTKLADEAEEEYERKLSRAIGRSDPDAGAGDAIILEPHWYAPRGYADDRPRAGRG